MQIDLFGTPVNPYINGHSTYKNGCTKFLCCFFIGSLIGLSFFHLFFYFKSHWKTVISSQTHSTIPEIKKILDGSPNNQLDWELNNSTFLPYFTLHATINGSSKGVEELKRYLSVKFSIKYENGSNEVELNSSECSDDEILKYLKLDDSYSFPNNSGTKICLSHPVNLSLYELSGKIFRTFLEVKVQRCQNSIENNFSCSTDEEFKEVGQNITFWSFIPIVGYSDNPYTVPKKAYEISWYHLNLLEKRKIYTWLSSHEFFLNEKQFQLDFTQEKIATDRYDISKIEEPKRIYFEHSFLKDMIFYQHHYQGLDFFSAFQNFFSQIWAVLSILFLIATIHNHFAIEKELINSM